MEQMDLYKYFAEKESKTGCPRFDSVKLLKIIQFAFMADGVGFEPTCRSYRQTDFECCINTFSKGKINTDKKLQKELKTLIYSGFSAPFLLLSA